MRQPGFIDVVLLLHSLMVLSDTTFLYVCCLCVFVLFCFSVFLFCFVYALFCFSDFCFFLCFAYALFCFSGFCFLSLSVVLLSAIFHSHCGGICAHALYAITKIEEREVGHSSGSGFFLDQHIISLSIFVLVCKLCFCTGSSLCTLVLGEKLAVLALTPPLVYYQGPVFN